MWCIDPKDFISSICKPFPTSPSLLVPSKLFRTPHCADSPGVSQLDLDLPWSFSNGLRPAQPQANLVFGTVDFLQDSAVDSDSYFGLNSLQRSLARFLVCTWQSPASYSRYVMTPETSHSLHALGPGSSSTPRLGSLSLSYQVEFADDSYSLARRHAWYW